MKTVEQVDQMIAQLSESITEQEKISSSGIKAMRNKISRLREYRLAIESNPKEDYLKSKKEQLLGIIEAKEAQFGTWLDSAPKDISTAQRKTMFRRESGIADLSKKVTSINFILSDAS